MSFPDSNREEDNAGGDKPRSYQPEITAIILSAGRSERMGAFKPLLPFGDKTVVDHCIDNLRQAGIESIVVVLGHHADQLRQHLGNSRVSFAVNPDPHSEMSGSIAWGVSALPPTAPAVVITPVDQPAFPAEVVSGLIKEWRAGSRLVIPTFDGRGGHPVLIDMTYREELLALPSNRGLRALFQAHQDQLKRLPVDSSYIARDMDTWDDYVALHEEVFGFSPLKALFQLPK